MTLFWGVTSLLCACNPASESSQFAVRNSKQEVLATISVGADQVTVDSPQGTFTGIFKKDKRKYYDGANSMRYAVKFSDDGFKLRDHNEELLWKVKLYDDKIKLADNEEMNNAYEIKLKEEGRVKVEKNESLLKELRLNAAAEWFQVNDEYSTQGAGMSLAVAVLLIEELTDVEKFILMAELKAKGK